jgi:hypothetical protein
MYVNVLQSDNSSMITYQTRKMSDWVGHFALMQRKSGLSLDFTFYDSGGPYPCQAFFSSNANELETKLEVLR